MIESLDLPPLPEGWVWTKVREIGQIISGQTPKGINEHGSDGEIPYFKVGDMNKLGNETYMFYSDIALDPDVIDKLGLRIQNKGTVIFPKRGGAIGTNKKRILAQPSAYDLNIMGVYPVIMPYLFFYYWILSVNLITLSDGSNVPQINHKDVEPLRFPLPPLPEQHRIVAKIEELFTKLDAGVESLKNVKAQLRLYRQAVLKHAFEGKLTEEWKETHKSELEPASVLLERIKEERKKHTKGKYKELPQWDTSDLPELPEGWMWTRIGEICETTSGGTPSRKNKRYYRGDIPWMKSGELENNIITSAEEYITEEGLENSSAKIIPAGTLLIALYGATVGKLGILGIDSAINQAICAIFTPTRLEKKYLFWYLMGYRNELLNSRIGGAQPNISQTIVNKTILPLPSHSEQQIIVEEIERRFSVADDVEKTVDQSLKQAVRLRQSILKTAFEGKFVLQDSTDEPASVLLERIKAEREKREIEAKSKSKNKRKRDLVLKQRRFNDYVE